MFVNERLENWVRTYLSLLIFDTLFNVYSGKKTLANICHIGFGRFLLIFQIYWNSINYFLLILYGNILRYSYHPKPDSLVFKCLKEGGACQTWCTYKVETRGLIWPKFRFSNGVEIASKRSKITQFLTGIQTFSGPSKSLDQKYL